jgi:hypothetical protein
MVDAIDQFCHYRTDDRRVLELVPAPPDGHVKAAQIGPVIDRDPVVRDIIKRCNTA